VQLRRIATARDAQLLARDPDLFQDLEHIRRHAFGQIDEAVIVADIDAADVLAVQTRFVGNGADDVAGFYAMRMSDFDAECFEAGFGLVATLLFALRSRSVGSIARRYGGRGVASALMSPIAIRLFVDGKRGA